MSPKAFARSAVSAVILSVVACGDPSRLIAPAAPLELTPDAIAQVVSCDVSWIDATGGAWSDPLNWSTGTVPNATQNVCITLDGNYTVNVYGAATANTITIGATNNTGLVIVNVQVGGGSATLTGVNGIVNHGAIYMTGGITSNIYASALAVTNGTLVNNGTIGVYPDGVGAQRIIAANLVNNGLVSVHTLTQLSKAGAVFENRGNFTATGTHGVQVHLAGGIGQTFRQSAGTLNLIDAASLNVNKETFDFVGGTITGAPIITNGKLTIAEGNEAAGTFVIRGASSFAGNIAAAQTVYVQAQGAAATLTSATGFTNAGKVEFTYTFGTTTNQMYSALAITDGVLTNTGTLRMAPHFAWAQISADVTNLGVIEIQSIQNFLKPGAVIENRGTISVATGSQLNLVANTNQTFRQAAGSLTLTGSGTMTVNGGTVEVSGGTITGRPQLDNSVLRFAAECGGTGALAIRGANAKLESDVPAGWTVHVNSGGPAFAQLTSANGFTNRGTIELARGVGGDNTNTTMLTVTNGALTNEGTLSLLSDPHGAGRIINANIVNNGTVKVESSITTLARQNGTFVNNGTIAFNGPRILTATGMGQTFTTTGPITGGGRLEFKDITVNASGNVVGNLTLTNVALHIAGNSLGTLTLTGTYMQVTTTSLNVQLRDGAPGGYDRFDISGGAALGYFANTATLNVSAFQGACIEPNQTFDFMTYQSRAADFAVKNGLNLGGGRTLTANAGATVYRLTSAGPVCVPPDASAPIIAPNVSGTMGLEGWYTSDVTVSWTVTDAESPVTSATGCNSTTISTDTPGITLTCSATSAGGTRTQAVTFKRDATGPVIEKEFTSLPNQHGWYNTSVGVKLILSDDMSGMSGFIDVIGFSAEGADQSQTRTHRDRAGNPTTVTVNGINIDLTPPTASVTRSVEANANGWNNTSVMANFSATDALSGIDGNATSFELFSAEVANQGASRVFTDKAGNSATVSITGVSIDRTPPQVNYSRAPLANAAGWNNTDVTATYSASDPISGIDGAAIVTQLFALEGASQGGSHRFTDRAGNTATMYSDGINIDKTAPVVTVMRSPAPDASGWNDTDVTATWSASDALSGINGSTSATHLFNTDGASQSATRSFSDRAGNSAAATISNVNIDKTPAPPPPPPTLTPVCSVTPNEIWPANNKLVAVHATIGGTGVTSFKLRSVVNNESGNADVDGWAIGTADVDGSVLAKRNGGGTGRTYTLTYDVFGANGATGSCAVTVRVPHDQGRR